MSQCIRVTSNPKASIACNPTEPVILSRTSAIASSARPARSSFNASGRTPNTSRTAHSCAHVSTSANGVGEVNRLATSTSTICP